MGGWAFSPVPIYDNKIYAKNNGIINQRPPTFKERQLEGIAKAKAEGKYKGRKPTAKEKAEQINALTEQGMTRQAVTDNLGIGVASVYRVLKNK